MSQRTAATFAAASLGLALVLLVATADAQSARGARARGVTVYEHEDFGGRAATFYDDNPQLDGTPIGNDRVSSVRVDPGCEAILFEEVGFRGRSTVVVGELRFLRGTEVGNDRVSSLQVRCRRLGGHAPPDWRGRPGAVLYDDTGFEGRYEVFYDDERNLERSRIGNDSVSSLRVAPGCKVTLYEDANFRGARLEVTGELDDLRGTRVGNDRVSSLRLECWRRWR